MVNMTKIFSVTLVLIGTNLIIANSANAQGSPPPSEPTSTLEGSRTVYGPNPPAPGTPWNIKTTVTFPSSNYTWSKAELFFKAKDPSSTYPTTPLQSRTFSGSSSQNLVLYHLYAAQIITEQGYLKSENSGTLGSSGGYGYGGYGSSYTDWLSKTQDYYIIP
jgi:hypothetical protein